MVASLFTRVLQMSHYGVAFSVWIGGVIWWLGDGITLVLVFFGECGSECEVVNNYVLVCDWVRV